jgi:hypothetical protein
VSCIRGLQDLKDWLWIWWSNLLDLCTTDYSSSHITNWHIVIFRFNLIRLSLDYDSLLLLVVRVRVRVRVALRPATRPLRLTTSNFIFQLNTCGCSLYVTSSLTRGWVCRLQLLWSSPAQWFSSPSPHNKRTQTSIPGEGFEPTITVFEPLW